MNDKCTAEQVRDVHWNMAKEYKAIPVLAEPHQAMGDAIDALLRERESAKAAVTDETTQIALNAYNKSLFAGSYGPDDGQPICHDYTLAMRAALEVVAPMLASARVPDVWTRDKAKLHERKTVHEWLNDLHIEREEFGKPICLLRRLRILCDRYRETCEQLTFEIRKQVGWIDIREAKPVRNKMTIYWHNSEHGGFPAIADEWRDEHHLPHATYWLPYAAPKPETGE